MLNDAPRRASWPPLVKSVRAHELPDWLGKNSIGRSTRPDALGDLHPLPRVNMPFTITILSSMRSCFFSAENVLCLHTQRVSRIIGGSQHLHYSAPNARYKIPNKKLTVSTEKMIMVMTGLLFLLLST